MDYACYNYVGAAHRVQHAFLIGAFCPACMADILVHDLTCLACEAFVQCREGAEIPA
jgi:hypothetical protein